MLQSLAIPMNLVVAMYVKIMHARIKGKGNPYYSTLFIYSITHGYPFQFQSVNLPALYSIATDEAVYYTMLQKGNE